MQAKLQYTVLAQSEYHGEDVTNRRGDRPSVGGPVRLLPHRSKARRKHDGRRVLLVPAHIRGDGHAGAARELEAQAPGQLTRYDAVAAGMRMNTVRRASVHTCNSPVQGVA